MINLRGFRGLYVYAVAINTILTILLIAIRMGRISEDCTKTCPRCGEGNQSFEHWIFKSIYYSPLLGSNKSRTARIQTLINTGLFWCIGSFSKNGKTSSEKNDYIRHNSTMSTYALSRDLSIPPIAGVCTTLQIKPLAKWSNSNYIINEQLLNSSQGSTVPYLVRLAHHHAKTISIIRSSLELLFDRFSKKIFSTKSTDVVPIWLLVKESLMDTTLSIFKDIISLFYYFRFKCHKPNLSSFNKETFVILITEHINSVRVKQDMYGGIVTTQSVSKPITQLALKDNNDRNFYDLRKSVIRNLHGQLLRLWIMDQSIMFIYKSGLNIDVNFFNYRVDNEDSSEKLQQKKKGELLYCRQQNYIDLSIEEVMITRTKGIANDYCCSKDICFNQRKQNILDQLKTNLLKLLTNCMYYKNNKVNPMPLFIMNSNKYYFVFLVVFRRPLQHDSTYILGCIYNNKSTLYSNECYNNTYCLNWSLTRCWILQYFCTTTYGRNYEIFKYRTNLCYNEITFYYMIIHNMI
ncbi:hypothetical protein H8356DRAFT_1424405 [Neocallimastix lanati (nom. inval.)]|nr:hypothetical protein H8356DRAFT_1424405 [Neocallimastix sp. JGI-2020a]